MFLFNRGTENVTVMGNDCNETNESVSDSSLQILKLWGVGNARKGVLKNSHEFYEAVEGVTKLYCLGKEGLSKIHSRS